MFFYIFSAVIYLDNQDAVEDDEDADPKLSKRRSLEIITFTEEQTAELAKDPGEEASVSERILAQSAAERDRISEIKDRAVELETEPKFANCCNFCPKSFKKPSDLVRYRKNIVLSKIFQHHLGTAIGLTALVKHNCWLLELPRIEPTSHFPSRHVKYAHLMKVLDL